MKKTLLYMVYVEFAGGYKEVFRLAALDLPDAVERMAEVAKDARNVIPVITEIKLIGDVYV